MPIKKWQDNHRPGSGLPRIGVLHKGAARTEEDIAKKRPGKDLDAFRIAFAPEYAHLQPAWDELYGAEPAQLNRAFLMTGDTDAAFATWLEEWGASGLFHRCDGETQAAWFDHDAGKVSRQPIVCAGQGVGCNCKQVGRLNFILPEFMQYARVHGYFTLATHSAYDVQELWRLLKDLEGIYNGLTGIPFTLARRPKSFEYAEKDKAGNPTGKRRTMTKSLVHLFVDPDFVAQTAYAALGGQAQHALPEPPRHVDENTGEIVQQPALPASAPQTETFKVVADCVFVKRGKGKTYYRFFDAALAEEAQEKNAFVTDNVDAFIEVGIKNLSPREEAYELPGVYEFELRAINDKVCEIVSVREIEPTDVAF